MNNLTEIFNIMAKAHETPVRSETPAQVKEKEKEKARQEAENLAYWGPEAILAEQYK